MAGQVGREDARVGRLKLALQKDGPIVVGSALKSSGRQIEISIPNERLGSFEAAAAAAALSVDLRGFPSCWAAARRPGELAGRWRLIDEFGWRLVHRSGAPSSGRGQLVRIVAVAQLGIVRGPDRLTR